MKILVVGGQNHYASWIQRDVEIIKDKLENVEDCDLVILCGGADVNPKIYGHKICSKTHFDDRADQYEISFYREAVARGIPIIGICKGAQLITALQKNGCLMQHVNGHATGFQHQIIFADGDNALASSTHHQMMYPFNVPNYEMIAWANPISDVYEYNDGATVDRMPNRMEPEIVFYSNVQALAIQPHPEMMNSSSRLVVKLNELIKEKFEL